ncbi:MAG: DUF2975 domain-containing protein [Alphaproteobacteria bacterium]|jgi:hypothetical protein|nr:DUF2975 domain-containing protein [Alphaproteobacteria bacterium]
MRALGPGSVSSLLKAILDVVRWALFIAGGAIAAALFVVLLLSFRPDLLSAPFLIEQLHLHGALLGPFLMTALLGAELYVGGAIVIVEGLRRIFLTLISGDPFHPANVRRLQVIAGSIAALELGRYIFEPLLNLISHGGMSHHEIHGVSLTTWFSVLVIVVLAEVFREGARLRREAELTI